MYYIAHEILLYLRKSGALETMFSKSAKDSLLSPSRSASSMALAHTSVTSSVVSSPLVSLFRLFCRSSLQMKLSLLKSGPQPGTHQHVDQEKPWICIRILHNLL